MVFFSSGQIKYHLGFDPSNFLPAEAHNILVTLLSYLPIFLNTKISLFLPDFQTKFSQVGLQPHQLIFWHMGTVCLCAFRISLVKGLTAFLDFFGLQDCLTRDFLSQSPKISADLEKRKNI